MMFQSSELIHFVFADPDDRFFRPSGLQLTLKNELYLLLKEQGFGEILFLTGSGSGRSAKDLSGVTDPDWERRWSKRGFFGGEKSPERYDRDCREWLQARFSDRARAGKSAVVMELAAFSALYRARPELLDALIESAHDDSRGSILVLRSSLNAADSMELLFGEESVFNYHDGKNRFLCKEVADVRTGRVPEAYSALRMNLGERCVTLNSMFRPMKEAPLEVRAELDTMLLCAMVRRGDLSLSAAERRQMVNLLYCAIHSRALQKRLELGPARSYAQFFGNLIREDVWTHIWTTLREELVSSPGAPAEPVLSIPAMRAQECDFIEIPGGLIWESARTNMLRSAEIPAWYLAHSGETRYLEAKKQLAFVQNRLLTPWIRELSPELLRYFDDFARQYQEAANEHGPLIPDYLDSTLKCMYFVARLCARDTDTADAERICGDCGLMLQTAKEFALQQREVFSRERTCEVLRGCDPRELSDAQKLALSDYDIACVKAEQLRRDLSLLQESIDSSINRVLAGLPAPPPEPEPEPEPEPPARAAETMTAERARSVLERKANAARFYESGRS